MATNKDTPSEATSTFDSLQKTFWEPLTACFSGESAVDDKDTIKWIGLAYDEGSVSEDEDTLNGFQEPAEQLLLSRDYHSEASVSTITSRSTRSSNIPVLRQLPSFGSTLTHSQSGAGSHANSPSRQTAIRAMNGIEEELIINESKLPNIKTASPPRNPALMQSY